MNIEYQKRDNSSVAICIYSYNKADELKKTLASLSKTDFPSFHVLALNNASEDNTKEVIEHFLTNNILSGTAINLPVNIGAPGARNWLLKKALDLNPEYIAYLDDDVLLEENWLANLVESLSETPKAGVVGAKIINADPPKIIQHSGGILTSPEDWINNVLLWANIPDQGLFDNLSERDYLMGCANLYRTAAIKETGDFDIQFSPTQFDDVDHHLRMRLMGWKVLFNGHVEIRHLRKSGGTQTPNHLANRFKLQMKYDRENAQKIIKQNALSDFVRKHPWIQKSAST